MSARKTTAQDKQKLWHAVLLMTLVQKNKNYHMRTNIYLLLALFTMAFAASAQKYRSMLSETWENGAWVNSARMTNEFDNSGNLIKTTVDAWDSTGVWKPSLIMQYSLNSDATVHETLTKASEDGTTWEDLMKVQYTYNSSKQVLTENTYMFFLTSWLNLQSTTNTYDSGNKLVKTVNQSLDFMSMQLKNSTQESFTYNSDGTLNQSITQDWNLSNQWENSIRTTSSYNSSKRLTSDISEKWDSQASVWVYDNRTTYSYTNDLVTEMLEESYTNGAWVNSSLEDNTYNSNKDITQVLSKVWNTTLGKWENSSRMTFNYGNTGIQTAKLSEETLRVFPNPFKDEINIKNETNSNLAIKILNIEGKLIESFDINGPAAIRNLGSLKAGAYFMKVSTANGEKTIKMLKSK